MDQNMVILVYLPEQIKLIDLLAKKLRRLVPPKQYVLCYTAGGAQYALSANHVGHIISSDREFLRPYRMGMITWVNNVRDSEALLEIMKRKYRI